jgi:hypothetical protein
MPFKETKHDDVALTCRGRNGWFGLHESDVTLHKAWNPNDPNELKAGLCLYSKTVPANYAPVAIEGKPEHLLKVLEHWAAQLRELMKEVEK